MACPSRTCTSENLKQKTCKADLKKKTLMINLL